MILKSNAFRFGNEYYRQITGTTMETPMAPNYRIILTHLQTISSRTYCVVIFKMLDFHLRYGFVLLTISSSYGPVTRACWIISFPSHRIREL